MVLFGPPKGTESAAAVLERAVAAGLGEHETVKRLAFLQRLNTVNKDLSPSMKDALLAEAARYRLENTTVVQSLREQRELERLEQQGPRVMSHDQRGRGVYFQCEAEFKNKPGQLEIREDGLTFTGEVVIEIPVEQRHARCQDHAHVSRSRQRRVSASGGQASDANEVRVKPRLRCHIRRRSHDAVVGAEQETIASDLKSPTEPHCAVTFAGASTWRGRARVPSRRDVVRHQMRLCVWPMTKTAYVKAMFHPGRVLTFPLDAAVIAQIPDDLAGDVPTSARDLADLPRPAWQRPDPSTADMSDAVRQRITRKLTVLTWLLGITMGVSLLTLVLVFRVR